MFFFLLNFFECFFPLIIIFFKSLGFVLTVLMQKPALQNSLCSSRFGERLPCPMVVIYIRMTINSFPTPTPISLLQNGATSSGNTFADPENAPVEDFSSRGTCMVDTGGGVTERLKPVTLAADGLSTSTPGDQRS